MGHCCYPVEFTKAMMMRQHRLAVDCGQNLSLAIPAKKLMIWSKEVAERNTVWKGCNQASIEMLDLYYMQALTVTCSLHMFDNSKSMKLTL